MIAWSKRNSCRRLVLWLGAVVLAILAPQAALAVPDMIGVSGFLHSPDPLQPINGTYPMQVLFYDQASTDSMITSVTASIEVDNGLFGVPIPVPAELTTRERLWYRVSVDLDRNGFGPDELFQKFNEIVSVPFALTGKPVTYFETSGGHRIGFTGATSGPFVPNTLVLVPFCTPPGGVCFNRLALRAAFAGTSSYGIYDQEGNLVFSTMGRTPEVMGDPFVFICDEVRLNPSQIYYSAFTSSNNAFPETRVSMVPTLSQVGRIVGAGNNGQLPTSINFEQIQALGGEQTLSFGLYYVAPNSDEARREEKMRKAAPRKYAPEIEEMIQQLRATAPATEPKP